MIQKISDMKIARSLHCFNLKKIHTRKKDSEF